MNRLRPLAFMILIVACTSAKEKARADSAQALADRQQVLMHQLAAQKDSLEKVVDDADGFIAKIDSSVSRVKGLPKGKAAKNLESPIDQQIQARKDMLARVNALVERTRATAKELAAAQAREKELRGENEELKQKLDSAQAQVNALLAQIEKNVTTIAELNARGDSLIRVLDDVRSATSRAYVIIGKEKDLITKGVIVKEGGANLLFARVGRTLVPARHLDRDLFQVVDTRYLSEIPVPDTTRTYMIVSRQSLDDAQVEERDRTWFRGNLKILNQDQFWAPSRFLIIVER